MKKEIDLREVKEQEEALSFYDMNFKSILSHTMPPEAILEIAKEACESRQQNQKEFDARMSHMLSNFDAGHSSDVMQPVLNGWDVNYVNRLKAEYGGVLLGLFHYGPHRHTVIDLACLGIEAVTPIAKRAYWGQYELRNKAPAEFSECLQLVEVEADSVGKDLLVSLKRGKAGLIYVDGNMGPDNTHSREGTVIVNFCGRKISVKTGIVRLSQAFKYPIIPILTSQTKQQGKANHLVEMGDPILPRKITGQTKAEYQYETMQSLYLALEKRVKKDPTQWEYALCLHRWLTQTPSESTNSQSETKVLPPIDELLGVDEHIVINPKTTAKIQKGDKCVLVDVREGRGYIPPIWMPDLFDDLSQEDGTSLRAIKSKSADEESYQKTLSVLDQLRSIDLLTIKQVST